MVKFKNVEEITKSFINDGWNESTTFSELSEKEASKKGYSFAVNGIRKGFCNFLYIFKFYHVSNPP